MLRNCCLHTRIAKRYVLMSVDADDCCQRIHRCRACPTARFSFGNSYSQFLLHYLVPLQRVHVCVM